MPQMYFPTQPAPKPRYSHKIVGMMRNAVIQEDTCNMIPTHKQTRAIV